MIIFSSHSNFR